MWSAGPRSSATAFPVMRALQMDVHRCLVLRLWPPPSMSGQGNGSPRQGAAGLRRGSKPGHGLACFEGGVGSPSSGWTVLDNQPAAGAGLRASGASGSSSFLPRPGARGFTWLCCSWKAAQVFLHRPLGVAGAGLIMGVATLSRWLACLPPLLGS